MVSRSVKFCIKVTFSYYISIEFMIVIKSLSTNTGGASYPALTLTPHWANMRLWIPIRIFSWNGWCSPDFRIIKGISQYYNFVHRCIFYKFHRCIYIYWMIRDKIINTFVLTDVYCIWQKNAFCKVLFKCVYCLIAMKVVNVKGLHWGV